MLSLVNRKGNSLSHKCGRAPKINKFNVPGPMQLVARQELSSILLPGNNINTVNERIVLI